MIANAGFGKEQVQIICPHPQYGKVTDREALFKSPSIDPREREPADGRGSVRVNHKRTQCENGA